MHDQDLVLEQPVDEGLKVHSKGNHDWRFKDVCAPKRPDDFQMMFKDVDKVERYEFKVVDMPKPMVHE
eukprot:CAMPEP_0116902552 /NCGR_PEP_ID=MMETSP0467-20121206/10110_1 /TAXON_ID=283647 /ORGANISM="Mesodinium pulex, Strain SPMC105" /LENGTH=67 /DNA_ID=CAMNT_0004576465 /DNA_START=288 /DNA_END=491 /DNA_ORIENTATION=+